MCPPVQQFNSFLLSSGVTCGISVFGSVICIWLCLLSLQDGVKLMKISFACVLSARRFPKSALWAVRTTASLCSLASNSQCANCTNVNRKPASKVHALAVSAWSVSAMSNSPGTPVLSVIFRQSLLQLCAFYRATTLREIPQTIPNIASMEPIICSDTVFGELLAWNAVVLVTAEWVYSQKKLWAPSSTSIII